jgi:hypothetical protein
MGKAITDRLAIQKRRRFGCGPLCNPSAACFVPYRAGRGRTTTSLGAGVFRRWRPVQWSPSHPPIRYAEARGGVSAGAASSILGLQCPQDIAKARRIYVNHAGPHLSGWPILSICGILLCEPRAGLSRASHSNRGMGLRQLSAADDSAFRSGGVVGLGTIALTLWVADRHHYRFEPARHYKTASTHTV